MVRPGVWVKKSKFYKVKQPSDAVSKYTGRARKNGTQYTIMWCEKDRRHGPERLIAQTSRIFRDIQKEQVEQQEKGLLEDVKSFLSLGGELLQELHQGEKEKVMKRRYNDRRKKEAAAYQP